MKYTQHSYWSTAFVAMQACMAKWGLTLEQMAQAVKKYNIASIIEQNEDWLNHYGPAGAVLVIEKFILRDWGALPNGVKC